MGLSTKTRVKLAQRAGWRCVWCDQKTREKMGWQNSATIEHMLPVCEGGSNKLENLASACARCNRLRGTQCAELFKWIAAQLPVDTRLQCEALDQERKHNRKIRQQQLAAKCGSDDQFTYLKVPDQELNSKERYRKDRTLVNQALAQSRKNPFEPGSRRHRLFETECVKLPPEVSMWRQLWNKLTAGWCTLYSAIKRWEKPSENSVR